MKQGQAINRIVMLLLFAAILAYLGGAAWRGLRDPYPVVRAYSYAVEDTLEVTGYLSRQEEILSREGGSIVRLVPGEGEKVANGATVALLYSDRASLERSDRLKELEAEADQLSAAIAAAGEPAQGDSDQLVVSTMVALRSAVEKGDFTRLEDRTGAFKSAVYQQAQRYGEAGELVSALQSVQAEMERLRAQTAQSIGRVTVSRSGIFSGQADGLESILTPDSLESLTPADLDDMENRSLAVSASILGKLITDTTWYFVCPIPEADSHRLSEGETVKVRFSRDWSGDVEMTVVRIGTPQNGRSAVILSSDRYLSDVTLLRRQTVELVFSSKTGIRVPANAVRVEEITKTDPETGETTVTGKVTCVFVRVGIMAERKPVNVLAQGKDYYIVEPALPADPGQTLEKKALRPGDDVIVGGDVWDGKVLQ